MGILYIVATPIGNLEDITLRALRVLGEVPLIAAEDTRTIRKLLSHHKIRAPKIVSYTERVRERRTPRLLAALESGDIALVSEAGTPGISDPGVHLAAAAAEAGHVVVPVPGASALAAALSACGLPTRRFHYLGFLPRQPSQRRKLLREASSISETLVLFESPHRIRAALKDLIEAFGDRRVAVCRELTKLYEETFRGTLSEAQERFSDPRGEFTLVIEGAGVGDSSQAVPTVDAIDVDEELRTLRRQGLRAREAVRRVTERSRLPRSKVYARWLALAGDGSEADDDDGKAIDKADATGPPGNA